MRVFVEGVGLLGPGLDGWSAGRRVLAGEMPFAPSTVLVPQSPLLPPNERRRTVQTVKVALAVATEAFAASGRDPTDTATVFSSSGGDGATLHEILDVLASPTPELSPTRFHNSVHNAPAGYWTIATRSDAPSTSLCCHDGSFAAGLLDAAVQATTDNRAVALIAYDVPYPEPLHSVRPIGATFGVALVLAPHRAEIAIAQLEIGLQQPARSTTLSSRALEDLRCGTPAARSLPLLIALAQRASSRLALDYISGIQIGLGIEPIAASRASGAGVGSIAVAS
jgi:hypothetical protein